MYILAIESAAATASVSIMTDDLLLAEYTINAKMTHSQTLLPMIDDICKRVGVEAAQLDYIAVSAGPGSYTGLRIGAATAKGIALGIELETGNEIPLVPVATLEGLAYNLYGQKNIMICPVMDARRERVYTGIYEYADNGDHGTELKIIADQKVKEVEGLIEELNRINKEVVFLGDGTDLIKKHADKLTVEYSYAPGHLSGMRAGSVASAAADHISRGCTVGVDVFVPDYLVESQAERQSFRLMEMRDIEAVSRIEEESIPESWSARSFEEALNSGNACFIVCENGNTLKGYIGMWISADEAEITNVAVDKDYRRIGVGRGLIEKLKEKGIEKGVRSFFLEVRESNDAARSLYKKCGFKEVGLRKDFYTRPNEDAILMKFQV